MSNSAVSVPMLVPGAPNLSQFCENVQGTFRVLRKTLQDYLLQLRQQHGYPQEADKIVTLALALGESIGLTYEEVLDAYADFCLTFLREQGEFLKTGKYRNASEGFETVRHEVY